MRVLVTGGTGFVGTALVRELLAQGHEVRVLVQPKDPLAKSLEGLQVERIEGDVQDEGRVAQAVAGRDWVFHAAAVYDFLPWWQREAPRMYATNVEGTRTVVRAALSAQVHRFVHTSTLFTLGLGTRTGTADEQTPIKPGQFRSHYARSKFLSEQVVLEAVKHGLPAVVVNPAMVIGDGDARPTPSGDTICKFLRRQYPAYFSILMCVADVRDVARGHVLAAEKGLVGERYYLGTDEQMPLGEFFALLEQVSGVPRPKLWLPYAMILMNVFTDELLSAVTHHQVLLPYDGIRLFRYRRRFSTEKAKRELGFQASPLKQTLARAVAWFREHGYVQKGV